MTPATLLSRASDAAAALLGCWALYAWVAVYAGASLTLLRFGLVVPLLAAGVLVWQTHGSAGAAEDAAGSPPRSMVASGVTFAMAVASFFGWWAGPVPLAVAGLLALVHLATLLPTARSPLPELRATWLDVGAVVGVGLVAVAAVLILNRPDIDDAYYFNAIWTHLAQPERAVLSFDGMHGEPDAPIQQLIHRPQTFELLATVVASIPGISAATSYYVVLPAFFAGLTVLASWLVLARLTPRSASFALVVLVVLLLAWGDGHRTWGNYAFVRMYQGKAVFMCALAPLVVHQAFQYSRAGGAARLALLTCAVAAASSVTSSALVVAPVVLGLALLGGAVPSRDGAVRAVVGLSAAVPTLAVLGLVRFELSQAAPLVTEGDVLAFDALTGPGVRGPLVMGLVLALPLLLHLARSAGASVATRWGFVAFLFVLNGLSAPFLAEVVAALLSWRLYWAAPVPLFAAAAIACGARVLFDRVRGTDVVVPALVLGLLCLGGGIGFAAADRWTVESKNRVHWEFAVPKRPKREWPIAAEAVQRAPEGSSILAPTRIGVWLTGFEEVPRLVAVRSFYTNNLARFWGAEESAERAVLQKFVEGRTNAQGHARALRALDERCIRVVVTAAAARKKAPVRTGLVERGFVKEKRGAYDLWTRQGPVAACEP